MWVTIFHLIGISLTSTISPHKVGSIGEKKKKKKKKRNEVQIINWKLNITILIFGIMVRLFVHMRHSFHSCQFT